MNNCDLRQQHEHHHSLVNCTTLQTHVADVIIMKGDTRYPVKRERHWPTLVVSRVTYGLRRRTSAGVGQYQCMRSSGPLFVACQGRLLHQRRPVRRVPEQPAGTIRALSLEWRVIQDPRSLAATDAATSQRHPQRACNSAQHACMQTGSTHAAVGSSAAVISPGGYGRRFRRGTARRMPSRAGWTAAPH